MPVTVYVEAQRAVTAGSAGALGAGTRTAPATPTLSTCTAPVRAGRRRR